MRRSYYLEFDNKKIPDVNKSEDISGHEAKSGVIETCGGYIDGFPVYSPITAKTVEVSFDICGNETFDVDSELETWKGKTAKKGKLYRRVGRTQQWAYARLMNVAAETDYKDHFLICSVRLTFEIISRAWYGQSITSWNFDGSGKFWDTGLYFDAVSEYSVEIPAGGNYILQSICRGNMNVTDINIRIKTTNAIPAGLHIMGNGSGTDILWHFYFNQEIPAGVLLDMQAGKKLCRYGNYSYPGFDIHRVAQWNNFYSSVKPFISGTNSWKDHKSMYWIELEPAENLTGRVNFIYFFFDDNTTTANFDLFIDYIDMWR